MSPTKGRGEELTIGDRRRWAYVKRVWPVNNRNTLGNKWIRSNDPKEMNGARSCGLGCGSVSQTEGSGSVCYFFNMLVLFMMDIFINFINITMILI